MATKLKKAKTLHNGKKLSTDAVLKREPGSLTIPIRELDAKNHEGIVLGFRQPMIDIPDMGGVSTGAGLGTDFIILEWGERQSFVRGSELLKAWVATFAPEDADRMTW